MSQNSFTISYPALHSGTEKSIINFMAGIPDLAKLFFESEEAAEKRRRFFDSVHFDDSAFERGKHQNESVNAGGNWKRQKARQNFAQKRHKRDYQKLFY